MAAKPGSSRDLPALREEIALSRARLGRDVEGLRYELDFSRKIKRSFQENTATWIVAVAAVTAAVVFLPVRKKEVYVARKGEEAKRKGILQAGVAIGALRLVGVLIRPLVISFVTRKLGSMGGRMR